VIGYLTKLYLVPVFVVTLALWWLVRFVLARRSSRAEGRQAGRGAAVLLAIAAGVAVVLALPWVIALSAKYGYPTIGSSFSVNVDAKFEPSAAASPNPSVTPEPRPTILHAPPNQYATSFGEDRTFQVDQGPKSDASVLERARYYVAERFAAFPYYLERIVSIAPFALLAIIGLGLAIIFGRIKYRENAPALMVGLLWSVYFLGYAAITSAASGGGNLRYYWPLFALSLVMIALLVPTIWKALAPGPRWRKIVVAVLLAVVPFAVYWQHGLNRPGIFSSSSPSSNLSYLFTTPTPPVDRVFAEEELADIIPPGSKIAGSAYRPTVKYGYYLQAQVYGRSDQGYDALDPSFQELLRETGIEYYLDYTPSGGVRADLSELGETVGEYVTPQVCVDDKGAPVDESCQISVIRVSR